MMRDHRVDELSDDEHLPIVSLMIAKARDASIESRAKVIQVPSLNNTQMVIAGAGNYQAMCAQCHLSPGLSRATIEPAIAFWTIKHGGKASGMPA